MNPINNLGNASPLQKIVSKPVQKSLPADLPKQLPATDKLELSGMSHLMKSLKAGGDIRTEKVAEIKAQIAAGTYGTDQQLDAALDGLLDDLLK